MGFIFFLNINVSSFEKITKKKLILNLIDSLVDIKFLISNYMIKFVKNAGKLCFYS